MPIFKFYAGDGLSGSENNLIATSVGSGLGFFGSVTGLSVQVGSYQSTTAVTDANGANAARGTNNIKYILYPGLELGLDFESNEFGFIIKLNSLVNTINDHNDFEHRRDLERLIVIS